MDAGPSGMTFIVRVFRRDGGELVGLVEWLRTGKKQPFRGVEAISQIIQRHVGESATDPPATARADPGAEEP